MGTLKISPRESAKPDVVPGCREKASSVSQKEGLHEKSYWQIDLGLLSHQNFKE